jgi:regulator of protease activity HflC (stomatin/prohibitin superfamily)
MKYVLILLILAAIALAVWGCAEVGPQEVGVRTTMIGLERGLGDMEWFKRGIKSKALSPGRYVSIPHVSYVETYPVNEQRYNMFKDFEPVRNDISFKTRDGQIAWIDATIRYRLMYDKIPVLHREYGHDYLESVLLPTIRSLLNNKLGEYAAEEIYDGKIRQLVSVEVTDLVNRGQEGRRGTMDVGLEVIDVLLRRFEFTEEFQTAIEQKKIASEQHLAAVEWAKKREAEAEGEKLALIQNALGRAAQVREEADADLYSRQKAAKGIRDVGLAEAEARAAMVQAMGGGDILVQLEFAKNLSPKLQIWGIPTGQQNHSIMDLSGVFGSMFQPSETSVPLGSGVSSN